METHSSTIFPEEYVRLLCLGVCISFINMLGPFKGRSKEKGKILGRTRPDDFPKEKIRSR